MNNNAIVKRIEDNHKQQELDENPPKPISHTQVASAKAAWTIGALLIDVATAYAVWQITFWWWGAFWFLAGAGGLIWSQWLYERVGNNATQRKISHAGIITSAVCIVLMAILAGTVYMLGYTKLVWVEVLTFVSVIALFCYHVLQAYRYQMIDDKYIEETKEARAVESHDRKMREIERARRETENAYYQADKEQEYRERYGPAFDTALGVPTVAVDPQVGFVPKQATAPAVKLDDHPS